MKEIYVFGAGASKASAEAPLGVELVWDYYQDCHLMTPIIDDVPDNRGANMEFANFIKYLSEVGDYFPELKGEVDKFLKRGIYIYTKPYTMQKRHYVDDILKKAYEKRDLEFIELIRKLIFEHLVESNIGRSNKLYESFIIDILKGKSPKNTAIISFNFDFLLTEDFYNDVYFDYLLEFDWVDSNRKEIYKQQNPYLLLKLNGSLDWGICSKCNKLHLFFPHMQKDFYNNQVCNCCKSKVSPFIVIPHEEYRQMIKRLWEKASEILSKADKITVIGYSFPEYDTKVIDLFRNALPSSTTIEVVDFCFSDKDKVLTFNLIKEKYARLFPGLRKVDISLAGFEGYIKKFTGGADIAKKG